MAQRICMPNLLPQGNKAALLQYEGEPHAVRFSLTNLRK